MERFNRIKKLYNSIAIRKYNFWLWYWYKRGRCPECHQKIRWEQEFESVWDTEGYSVPYHVKEGQDDECEGVC